MRYFFFTFLCFISIKGFSQDPIGGASDRLRNLRSATTGQGSDSLGKRNKQEDSITISYRYLDTTRQFKLDSSIHDFTTRYPIPADHYFLGNTGNPTESFLFSPQMRSGWDPGYHSLDVYKFTVDRARFFTTTRPYSEINYMLATRSEQYIELLHTQNIRPNWNAHFQYRFINAPGIYKSQKTSHNNYLLTNWVQSKNKRYNNYVVILANKLQSGTNGGMLDTLASGGGYTNYIDNPDFKDRFSIPTKLGGDAELSNNFFNTSVPIGNKYNDLHAVLRQQFDFGRKDSLVTDSTVVPLFFPRLRLEHTIQYANYRYFYDDDAPETAYYQTYYNLNVPGDSTIRVEDKWKELLNDFSIYTFPDAKNTQQFIKVGAALQNLSGQLKDTNTIHRFTNVFGHGEYRNRTKNQKWDMMAYGKLYFIGLNAGDYEARASIQSLLGKKIGSLRLGVENVNRSPNYTSNSNSSFYLPATASDFKKENSTHLYADIYQPLLKLNLNGHYYLVSNFLYLSDFYNFRQYGSVFSLFRVSASKVFEAGRKNQWKWRSDVSVQKTIGNAPVNVPLFYTRNRFAYEGDLGYPHLDIAFGFDTRYRSNYKGNNYSPILGQFFYQNDSVVKYKLPDIAAFVHFRINSFKAFVRAENLNTFRNLEGTWGFSNNNFAAPGYAYPGLLIRLGIYWGFVN